MLACYNVVVIRKHFILMGGAKYENYTRAHHKGNG